MYEATLMQMDEFLVELELIEPDPDSGLGKWIRPSHQRLWRLKNLLTNQEHASSTHPDFFYCSSGV